jgi:hypothetical protein
VNLSSSAAAINLPSNTRRTDESLRYRLTHGPIIAKIYRDQEKDAHVIFYPKLPARITADKPWAEMRKKYNFFIPLTCL